MILRDLHWGRGRNRTEKVWRVLGKEDTNKLMEMRFSRGMVERRNDAWMKKKRDGRRSIKQSFLLNWTKVTTKTVNI